MLTETPASLSHLNPLNEPGICTLKAVPHDKCVLRTFAEQMKDTNTGADGVLTGLYIGFPIGTDWLDVSKDFNHQLIFIEKETQTQQGKVFTYQLLFDLPNDDVTTRGKIIRAYDNRQWILKVELQSGSIRIVGSNERGADFSAELNTGSLLKGANRTACGFTWQSFYRAFYAAS